MIWEDSLLVNVKLLHTWHRSLKAGLILKSIWKVPWNKAPMEQVTLKQAEDTGRSLHVRQIGTRTRTGNGHLPSRSWNSERGWSLGGIHLLMNHGKWGGAKPAAAQNVHPGSGQKRCVEMVDGGECWYPSRRWLGRCPSTEAGVREDLKFGLGSATSNYRGFLGPRVLIRALLRPFGAWAHLSFCEPFPP